MKYKFLTFEAKRLPLCNTTYKQAWKEIKEKGILCPEVLSFIKDHDKDSVAICNDPNKPIQLKDVFPKKMKTYIEVIVLCFEYIKSMDKESYSTPVLAPAHVKTEIERAGGYLGYKLVQVPNGYTSVMNLDPSFKPNNIEPIHVIGRSYIKNLGQFLFNMSVTRKCNMGFYTLKNTYATHLKTFLKKGTTEMHVYFKNEDRDLVLEDFKRCYLDYMQCSGEIQ